VEALYASHFPLDKSGGMVHGKLCKKIIDAVIKNRYTQQQAVENGYSQQTTAGNRQLP
jgi:hypothetical protein